MGRIIGIDLGTTTSEIAYVKDGKPCIIRNIEEGDEHAIPSVVSIEGDEIKVGKKAKNQILLKPELTVAEVKRVMGTENIIQIQGKEYRPEEISALILKKLKEVAEYFLGEEVEEAVITVPANFNDIQRKATKNAGEIAGFKVERIINEPTAAAMAYGVDNLDKNGNILVYDFGGGTFDVTILEMFNGVLDVKVSRGNNYLGGKDIDNKLIDHVVNEFNKSTGVKLDISDSRILARLKEGVEEAKKTLSTSKMAEIVLPYISADKDNNPINLEMVLTREEFEFNVKEIIDSTEDIVNEALEDANITDNEIDTVLLVGGSSRIPYVRNMLEKRFKGKIARGVNPDEAVALGASVQAAIKNDIPVGDSGTIIVTDTCNYTLGVALKGGIFDPIIDRDSKLPANVTKRYCTVMDNQTEVLVSVYEGESRYVSDNTLIDEFILSGIPKADTGKEKIDITFTYDLNGILNVSAEILSTGDEISKIMSTKGLSKEEIQDLKEVVSSNENNNELVPWKSANLFKLVEPNFRLAERKIPMLPSADREKLQEIMSDMKDAIVDNDKMALMKLDEELTDFLFDFVN
ncbi:Hsp70 family protein [Clostridium perfringens]|uniref:Chaperone protein DnaK n=1 Tax=Clostridium perfringens TaxID=1502 RepID=A0A6G4ZGP8_CLOPF|nr:Hsp70 family protein [Clostridium perfringens]MBO3389203.1 Hsp70 family protein [Clostridium perfringens]MBO3414626.1 Hsp70 family protein [Clostridium perfringens]MDK0983942.1 Hsp70 family protein [Clostridium perfringens]NGT91137.1 Hsp70 family protein [Clostridium perfringens]HAT4252991.1 Hsp70 family protein [Clostridium perfringens]